MSGFAGFACYQENLKNEKYLWMALARRMCRRLSHRGPNEQGVHVSEHTATACARLAAVDIPGGTQPLVIETGQGSRSIVFDGMLYNSDELLCELRSEGVHPQTKSDTELVLLAYMTFGDSFLNKLNGMYSFVIDDGSRTFFCRDHFGLKPLFYTFSNDRIAFASEIKGLFEYPGVSPVIKKNGLCEIFGIGPARTPGNGVFDGIYEIKPGHFAVFNHDGFYEKEYFSLFAQEHTDNYENTVNTVRELLTDTVKRQMESDIPICSFLSGGLDSSVVTAIMSDNLKNEGKTIDTFSFIFEGNDEFFKPSSFQPQLDREWAELVAQFIGANHKNLYCSTDNLSDSLLEAVISKDLPGMTDIDGSLLYFCRQTKKTHGAALCGEGADEVFGGYPWFHRPEMYDGHCFPWSKETDFRMSLLNPDVLDVIDMQEYISQSIQDSILKTPLLGNESYEQKKMREISHLTLSRFMPTLTDRADRCSAFSGFQMRLPFGDHRLAQYLFNVPWEFKIPNGVNKGLLRDASKGFLPDEILYRKKSPYPKTYHPAYEQGLRRRLSYILKDSLQPIHKILSKKAAASLLNESFDYGKPWFGQLMAGPQLLAYLIQINYWLIHYQIYIDL